MDKEQHIIQSWQLNAKNWISIIDSNAIESRKLVTNQAIIDAVCSAKPLSVLDIGCGEGWLAKELSGKKISLTGIDVIPELVEKAREKLSGDFYIASYTDIARGKINFSKLFDAVVVNFALIGKESTEDLLASLPRYLSAKGKLFIQTLHPYSRKSMNDYTTGWKQGSWDGLGDQFIQPYEWYFRTLEDWLQLLDRSGFGNIHITETLHPRSGQLLSVIFECGVK
ncbi:MAG: class I SAM-dependent methyltransferase [Bacteroidota bacterium]|nr:class I SAM-dependent methyltransferase [Bacteroidota bacterium]